MNRAKRPKPLEDLDASVDDILNNPITRSNLSFLVRPREELATNAIPAPGADIASGVVRVLPDGAISPAAISTPHGITAPGVDIAPDTDPAIGDNKLDGKDRPSPGATKLPDAITAPGGEMAYSHKPRQIHRCLIAQHGHSSNEQLVYQLLWSRGHPELGKRSRIVSLGVVQVARLLGTIHKRNVIIILQRLTQKQSIEIIKQEVSRQNESKQYRVFSYEDILERRKAIGMEWVVRAGRGGVEFVNPRTGVALLARTDTAPGGDITPGAFTSPGDASTSPPGGNMPPQPDGDIAPHLGNDRENKKRTTDEIGQLASIIQQDLPEFDTQGILKMVRACRQKFSGISMAEIEALFRVNLRGSLSRNIQNPVGYLIWKIPESCTPAAIGALRQGREVPLDDFRIEHAAEDLDALLDDPNTPEQIRQFIQQRMGK